MEKGIKEIQKHLEDNFYFINGKLIPKEKPKVDVIIIDHMSLIRVGSSAAEQEAVNFQVEVSKSSQPS